jgi:MFS transporter, OFA family, oxalate/formate antiporter
MAAIERTTGATASRGWITLTAALLVNLPTGTLYAFSVFIRYYEAALGVGRAELSTMFSLAAIGYTSGMLMGPVCYRWARPGTLVIGLGVVIAAGWSLAAFAPNLVVLGIAYGALFGVAGGMCYSVLAQVVNLSLPPNRRGFGNGFLVATFSAGAMFLAPVCALGLARYGLAPTLLGMAVVTLIAAGAAAMLVRSTGITLEGAATLAGGGTSNQPAWVFGVLWGGFALAASAGLMSLSQSAVIVAAYGGELAQSVLGTAGVAGAATLGRLAGGFLVDYFAAKRVILGAQAFGAISLVALLAWPSPGVAVAAMSGACIGYGLLSGSYAAAMVHYYGPAMFGRMTGRFYTAWGVAGILGPWVAGLVFDKTGGYTLAIVLAAAAMAGGFALSLALPYTPARREGDDACASAPA